MSEMLTTGDIAKYCGVHYRTVLRWIKDGRLKAFRLPNGGEHRVKVNDFLTFMQENELPIPEEFALNVSEQKVLIVDDDASMANAIARLLKIKNIPSITVNDGFQAGIVLQKVKPLLLILDIMMPGINGDHILTYLQQNLEFKTMPVIVISGKEHEELLSYLNKGASAIFSKPFDQTDFIETISKLLKIKGNR